MTQPQDIESGTEPSLVPLRCPACERRIKNKTGTLLDILTHVAACDQLTLASPKESP